MSNRLNLRSDVREVERTTYDMDYEVRSSEYNKKCRFCRRVGDSDVVAGVKNVSRKKVGCRVVTVRSGSEKGLDKRLSLSKSTTSTDSPRMLVPRSTQHISRNQCLYH
jgi:hypothetical protein